jgi:hypothetical protein
MNKDDKNPINFSIDPNKSPVFQVDGYLISSNEHTVTFSFAQNILGSNQQNVISRVALTRVQAKEFLKNLNDHIEKFEV